jgi:cell division protein YceG involved in septum cleavage
MVKKIFLLCISIIVITSLLLSWFLFGPTTGFSESNATIYIKSKSANKKYVIEELSNKNIIKSVFLFELVADRFNYWSHIQPGKYIIPKGSSIFYILTYVYLQLTS